MKHITKKPVQVRRGQSYSDAFSILLKEINDVAYWCAINGIKKDDYKFDVSDLEVFDLEVNGYAYKIVFRNKQDKLLFDLTWL